MARAERLWQEGSKAYSDQDWSKAATSLRELCERHESSPRADLAYFYLGESLLQSKRPEQARTCYDRFLEKKPRHHFSKQAQFRRGERAYLSGDHEAAGKTLQAFLDEHANDSLAGFATVYLGEMEMAAGRHEAALTWFTRAIEQFPQGPLVADCRFGTAFGGIPRIECEVVIGADGVQSRVRFSVFGADRPEFTGIVCWRGLIPKDSVPPGINETRTFVGLQNYTTILTDQIGRAHV